MTRPIEFLWDAEALAMLPRTSQAALARRQYVHGRVYRLGPQSERSIESLKHYHATLRDIYDNLSEDWREAYPTIDDFRKWALIKLGYRHVIDFPYETEAEAKKMEKRFQEFLGHDNEQNKKYVMIQRVGTVVRKLTAMSQSVHEADMDKELFEESKNRVLDFAASLVGTTRAEAQKNGSKGT